MLAAFDLVGIVEDPALDFAVLGVQGVEQVADARRLGSNPAWGRQPDPE
jgi:hypothetical protein